MQPGPDSTRHCGCRHWVPSFHPSEIWTDSLNLFLSFGGPAMIARTVTQYARAGVAALHIEDQVQTKRCGHLLGKQVVSREEFLTRVRAAVLARDSIPGGSDFVRTRKAIPCTSLTFDQGYHRKNRFCSGSRYG